MLVSWVVFKCPWSRFFHRRNHIHMFLAHHIQKATHRNKYDLAYLTLFFKRNTGYSDKKITHFKHLVLQIRRYCTIPYTKDTYFLVNENLLSNPILVGCTVLPNAFIFHVIEEAMKIISILMDNFKMHFLTCRCP